MKQKIIYALILFTALLSLNLNAQTFTGEKLESIIENCHYSLMHENIGVAEAAIFISIQFKKRYPQENDKVFLEALEELAQNSKSPVISYKAQLARIYFMNNDLFKDIEVNSIEEEQKVFGQISDRISNMRLAVN